MNSVSKFAINTHPPPQHPLLLSVAFNSSNSCFTFYSLEMIQSTYQMSNYNLRGQPLMIFGEGRRKSKKKIRRPFPRKKKFRKPLSKKFFFRGLREKNSWKRFWEKIHSDNFFQPPPQIING